MPEMVLVPIDGSEPAASALDYALERFQDAHLVVYHAVNVVDIASEADSEAPQPEFLAEQIETARAESEQLLEAAEERIGDTDAEVELDAEIGPPATNIVEYVEARDIDHVVIGSHGRTGLSRVVLGSVAEKVARRAPVPVTIIGDD